MFNLTEAIDSFDVEMDDEVDKDGFTVVQPLASLALESARGFASGLGDERVFVDEVDLETDKRLCGAAEDSEGAGIFSGRVQFRNLNSFQRISK